VSNRRKLARPPLPHCPDCDADLHMCVLPDGAAHVDLRHDHTCPAIRGAVPMPGLAWARIAAASGSRVVYTRDTP
jgi:hypothetical protein